MTDQFDNYLINSMVFSEGCNPGRVSGIQNIVNDTENEEPIVPKYPDEDLPDVEDPKEEDIAYPKYSAGETPEATPTNEK